MATKKAASNAKKTTATRPVAKKQTTTKVTTLKAVESQPTRSSAAVVSPTSSRRFGLMRTPIAAALIAEFIGTFIFAAVIIAGQGQPILALFALVGVVLGVGSVSGGYLNPALVVGAWVTRRMTGVRALGYVVAQVLGAMLALVVLNAFVGGAPAADQFSAAPSLFQAAALPESKEMYILSAEFVGALVFGFVAAGAYRANRNRLEAAFTIGLGAFLGLMVAGSAAAFVGANAILNPAVAISLQAVSFDAWQIAVYIAGPLLGAVVGFVLHELVRKNSEDYIA